MIQLVSLDDVSHEGHGSSSEVADDTHRSSKDLACHFRDYALNSLNRLQYAFRCLPLRPNIVLHFV